MDGEYATLSDVKNVLGASFDHKNGETGQRNNWVAGLRTKVEGQGDEARKLCCQYQEETFSSPMLGPNKRSLMKKIPLIKAGRPNQKKLDQSKESKTVEGSSKISSKADFVTACSQSKKEPRYVFRYSKANLKSRGPSKDEIPYIEIQKSPIQEKISIKPLITAIKRPQTSNRRMHSVNLLKKPSAGSNNYNQIRDSATSTLLS